MTTLDTVAVRELALVSINNESFYIAVKSLFPTLFNHYVSGKWDKQKAEKAIYNVVTSWAKDNANTCNLGWKPAKDVRLAAASEIFDHYEEELTEYVQKSIGKENLFIQIANFDHDVYGNPTAYHFVLGYARPKRRVQIGYGDHLDGCYSAIEKAVGKKAAKFYNLTFKDGSRSDRQIDVIYTQLPINLSGVAL